LAEQRLDAIRLSRVEQAIARVERAVERPREVDRS
jgi:hypothetical protein